MLDVITIGDSAVDIFLSLDQDDAHLRDIRHERTQLCLNFASKLPVAAKHDCVGGNAANAAVAFGRLGLNAAIYSIVGRDASGQRIKDELSSCGVSLRYVETENQPSTNYNTVLTYNGERTILVYHQKRHYVLPRLNAASWIYFTSMKDGFEKILPDLLGYVIKQRAQLVYQPGTFQLRAGQSPVAKLMKHMRLIVMNKEEAEHFLGYNTEKPIDKLLKEMWELGPLEVLITDSAKGAYAFDGKQYYHLAVLENIPRIDTTGAGDSFASGYCAARMQDLPIEEALRWGQMEASSVIQYFGAQSGLLYKKQMEYQLDKYIHLQTEIGKL